MSIKGSEMNKRKKVFSLVFLLLIFGLTCYTIFSKNDLTEILHWIRKIQLRYLIFAMLLVPVFVCSESIIFKYLFKQFGTHVPIYHCCKYSFVGFFYSCITPSASGGQPMQLIYMSKDHLNVSDGSIVLIIVTIGYKMVLVIAGIITILFRKEWLYECMGRSIGLCYLGILLNVICIMTMFLLIFSKKIVKKVDNCICVRYNSKKIFTDRRTTSYEKAESFRCCYPSSPPLLSVSG